MSCDCKLWGHEEIHYTKGQMLALARVYLTNQGKIGATMRASAGIFPGIAQDFVGDRIDDIRSVILENNLHTSALSIETRANQAIDLLWQQFSLKYPIHKISSCSKE